MLVFFIHGVATKNSDYSESLSRSVRDSLNKTGQDLPLFYPSFWGDVLKDKNQIWNHIFNDLRAAKSRFPKINSEDIFKYSTFREGFLSDFMGDVLTYLNEDRGQKIRQKLTDQLEDFINHAPGQKKLNIVAHSLGTVILFDMLFSDRFYLKDPVFRFRSLIEGLHCPNGTETRKKVSLRSITTMGSPILGTSIN